MTRVTMWKAPARREYSPKPMDAGQRVTWQLVIPGHYAVPPHYDEEADTYIEGIGWTEPVTHERSGVIWSAGPAPRTWWAVPDDEPLTPVVIRWSGRKRAGEPAPGDLFESSECQDWRTVIRRAENVRKRGVYAVVLPEPPRTGSAPYEAYSSVQWHCDPDCPLAAGRERADRPGGWTLHRIVDVLVGRERFNGEPPFCRHCIMLDPDAEPQPKSAPEPPAEPAVAVYDVDTGESREVSRAEAAAGMIRYARRELGAGTPACGVAEQHAVALLDRGPEPGRDPETSKGATGMTMVTKDTVTITETPDTAQWDAARAEARARMAAATQQLRTARTVPVAAAVAAQRGCKHWNSKYGTPAECGDCPARRGGGGGQIATTGGTVATRTEPIDGARLLNLADAWMGRHVWMSDPARHTAVLYTAAQHFRIAGSARLAWPRFGRLLYTAGQPGSGKTTAMVLMGYMCAPYFFGVDANPTAPGLCASIKEERAALFIDEFHRLVGAKGTRKADVVTILNVGYEKNGTYPNARGGKVTRTPVYAPAVMAGKDTLLTSAGEEIADLIDRCAAVIRMTRPPAGADLAEITEDTAEQGAAIAGRLAAWAAEQLADTERFREAFTTAAGRCRDLGLDGRAKDVWAPLIATAWLASEGHADAACDAALEFRRNRPAPTGEDPLAGLEDELAGGGPLASWG